MAFLGRYLILFALLAGSAWQVDGAASKYRWKRGVIKVAFSSSMLASNAGLDREEQVLALLTRSADAWQKAADLRIVFARTDIVDVSPSGPQGDGVSLLTIAATPDNLAMFPRGFEDAAARTRVFFDASGYITEADIVLNPYLQFSSNGAFGTFDLESTITHEIGHLLGLGHSPVLSATMAEHQGRNGTYGLTWYGPRTLSADDVASIRSLYGAAERSEECCGRIDGRLLSPSGRAQAGITVWVESPSGMVLASTVTGKDGSFRIGGLDEGRVRLLCQGDRPERRTYAAELGSVSVVPGETVRPKFRIDLSTVDTELPEVGFNGQLAGLPVPIDAGYRYLLMVGVNAKQQLGSAGTSSSNATVLEQTGKQEYSDTADWVGLEIGIRADTLPGDLSLYFDDAVGRRRYVIGALSLDTYRNLWVQGAFD